MPWWKIEKQTDEDKAVEGSFAEARKEKKDRALTEEPSEDLWPRSVEDS